MCHCDPSSRHCECSEAISQLNILSLPVHPLPLNDVVNLVKNAIAQHRPLKITTINSIIAVMAQRNPDLRKAVLESDIIVPDSVGIVWAGKMSGHCNLKRLTGIDLARELLCHAENNNWRVFLLGAKPGVAGLASKNLNKIYPRLNIVGVHHGYFENAEEKLVVQKISVCVPDLLLVGIGSPRQEIWINKLNITTVAIGVGGTLDVFAGNVKRAPGWIQKCGLEWLFRLTLEPHRFWRIVLYLPLFVALVFIHTLFHNTER